MDQLHMEATDIWWSPDRVYAFVGVGRCLGAGGVVWGRGASFVGAGSRLWTWGANWERGASFGGEGCRLWGWGAVWGQGVSLVGVGRHLWARSHRCCPSPTRCAIALHTICQLMCNVLCLLLLAFRLPLKNCPAGQNFGFFG